MKYLCMNDYNYTCILHNGYFSRQIPKISVLKILYKTLDEYCVVVYTLYIVGLQLYTKIRLLKSDDGDKLLAAFTEI